jgi:hypothetical protein
MEKNQQGKDIIREAVGGRPWRRNVSASEKKIRANGATRNIKLIEWHTR